MTRYKFTGILQELIEKAEFGNGVDVDFIMSYLIIVEERQPVS